jgi:hypothetical protein
MIFLLVIRLACTASPTFGVKGYQLRGEAKKSISNPFADAGALVAREFLSLSYKPSSVLAEEL